VRVSRLSFWIATLSLCAVLLIGLVDVQRTSPGPITNVHAQLEKLAGGESCAQCHGGWFSDMTDSCLECHAPVEAQIEEREGLHGAQPRAIAERCATCHSEHHGANFAIVNDQSFALAGAKNRAEFDHALIGWEMNGKHSEQECSKCHESADLAVLPEGTPRFLGLTQDCASCHEDPHKGRMAISCASCHGQETWDGLHSLGHEKRLPLIGGHGDISCRTCHEKDAPRSLEALGEALHKPKPRDCVACHESPHVEGFTQSAALEAELAPGAGCVVCHAAEHDTFRDERLELSPQQHAFSGFSIAAPHAELECAQCHEPKAAEFAARYPGRRQDQCSACHSDPHGAQFASGPFSGGDCIACHSRQHFEPHEFDLEKHARTALALEGQHAKTECAECHGDPAPDEPRVFRGTDSQCSACHGDAHEKFFDPKLAARSSGPTPANGDCARCHDAQSFSNAHAGFDHARWTGFEVLGAHAQSSCEACHPREEHPDPHGRTFGRVDEHFGEFESCGTCHDDPHGGDFDKPRHPKQFRGEASCARCHDSTSFRTLPHGFDHGLWTRFGLEGGHEGLSCSDCHTPLRKPDALGRTWARAAGSSCADCHDDPHAGQFDDAGAADCARCHTSDEKSMLFFDHELDSRFALGEAHSKLDCGACHAFEKRGDLEFVRYRPLGTRCVDCHGVGEDVLLRRKPRGGK
jgi:hypothetical protein